MTASRTRERILTAALALFNAHGEPNVTTNGIADELGISPGNLHYHFRTKQRLIDELFARFEQRLLALLGGDAAEHADVDDAWLLLHLVFETIADYRFLYRDLNELCGRSRDLRRRMRAVLKLSMRTASELLDALQRAGQCEMEPLQRDTAVRNIVLIASYWIAFDQIMAPREEPRPTRAAIQVMSIVSPYLRGDARAQFDLLAQAYRD
jgi:AcrR family transcriptional regulator